MKCIRKDFCRSPVACGGFGYCRERNEPPVNEHQIRARRAEEE